jgi:3-methylcrotonyl-CoA carboxylase alpha subunit
MIAKLIVRGPTRQAALQKLRAALESYEIGGPITNIEFLKRVCVSPAFVAGEVETGYIEKYRQELFERKPISPEVMAQAAIGTLLEEREKARKITSDSLPRQFIGNTYQQREYSLAEMAAQGQGKSEPVIVRIYENTSDELEVEVGDKTYKCTIKPSTANTFTTYFPHTRLETTFIRDEDRITTWQQGRQYRLQLTTPQWIEKALGIKDVANSVLAPMPCKVLRVDVKEGDSVKKDQVLAVIESMKMETVIRSPQDGVIAKVVHGPGVSLLSLLTFFLHSSIQESLIVVPTEPC